MRRAVLRANALFLLVAAAGGLRMDILGAFFGRGHVAPILASAPHAAIGFVEAHGFALIIGVPVVAGRAVAELASGRRRSRSPRHVQSGFWQIFVAGDVLWAGYVPTSLHGVFVILELVAATAVTTKVLKPVRGFPRGEGWALTSARRARASVRSGSREGPRPRPRWSAMPQAARGPGSSMR